MPADGLRALRQRVEDDPELADELLTLPAERFAEEVVAVAARLGLDVDAGEIEAAMAAVRHRWRMRWIA